MSSNQYIYIALFVLIVLSYLDFSPIFKFFQSTSTPNVIPQERDSLIEIVEKWDDLRNICSKNNLNSAVEKLDEIFPMLIKVGTK